MASFPYYNNTYIRVPTAYSEQAGFEANDLPDYGSYSGNLQRSQSRVSDDTGSFGSPIYPISPGASLDSYDYSLDSNQYVHEQAPRRSAHASMGPYTTSWTDPSAPRYGDSLISQRQTTADSPNLHPNRRSADLDRHIKHVHEKPIESYFCDYSRCQRSERVSAAAAASGAAPTLSHENNSSVGTGPFGRKDHCRDHYRTFHKEDLCRRNGKEDPGWFDDRNISTSWWRCTKCLKRVSYQRHGWQCDECEQRLEPERINARKRKMGQGMSSRGY